MEEKALIKRKENFFQKLFNRLFKKKAKYIQEKDISIEKRKKFCDDVRVDNDNENIERIIEKIKRGDIILENESKESLISIKEKLQCYLGQLNQNIENEKEKMNNYKKEAELLVNHHKKMGH